MGVVARAYSEVDGQIAEASSVNRVVDDLYTLVNGNINSANIIASGVAASNLETSSVITRALNDEAVATSKIASAAVVTSKIASQAIIYDHMTYEMFLAKEVFS